MAQEFEEGEFWLPSDLLYSHVNSLKEDLRCGQVEPSAIPGGRFSEPSPFASGRKQDMVRQAKVAGAPSCILDQEKEQEGYIAWLTRKMALSFLQEEEDEQKKLLLCNKAKQSTPCGWTWPESKKRGLDGASVVPPSLLQAVEKRKEEEAWDLLSQAAEQVMRLRLADLERRRNLYELDLVNTAAAVSHAPPPSCRNISAGHLGSSAVTRQRHLQALHYYRLKQMQSMKQQLSDRHGELRNGGEVGRHCRPPAISPSAFQGAHHQPQLGSRNGTKAIAMNAPRKESKGTGVFLPRTPGIKNESHKRNAGPAVHVPARVAQALNANLEELGAEPRFPSAGFALNRDSPVDWSKLLVDHQKWSHLHPQPAAATTGDISLPGEWTY